MYYIRSIWILLGSFYFYFLFIQIQIFNVIRRDSILDHSSSKFCFTTGHSILAVDELVQIRLELICKRFLSNWREPEQFSERVQLD